MIRKAVIVVSALLGMGYLAYWELAPDTYPRTLFATEHVEVTTRGPYQVQPIRDGSYLARCPVEGGKLCAVELDNGAFRLEWKTVADGAGPVAAPSPKQLDERLERIVNSSYIPLMTPRWSLAGFSWVDEPFRDRIYNRLLRLRALEVPQWFIVMTLLAYPAIAFYRGPLRRYRRCRRGLCVTCGYDLTGNVSGVCPECATEIGQR